MTKSNTPYLVVEGLVKHYGDGEARVQVLDGITTTVNRGTSFEHVTLTSAGIQAITVTDTVFLTIMILFVAYSVFVAALGHRHPLAPRLLYRVAMIGEERGSEKR